MNKKEIYFSRDVFEDVAKQLNLSPKVVEQAFNSFLKSYKKEIEETDDLIYALPYLGEFMISKGDASREIEKLKKRYYRTESVEDKEQLGKKIERYRIRLKKIKIELEKMKHNRKYLTRLQRDVVLARKQGLSSPENIHRKKLLYNTTFEEAMKKQNEYAYKYYEDNNLPVTL